MNKYDAIINPVAGKNPPDVGTFSIMVSQTSVLRSLCRNTGLDEKKYQKKIMTSRFYAGGSSLSNFSLIGPVVGASYAAILLETLIAWGAQEILFLGCCGAVSSDVVVGDIIIPTASIIDEGVSKHYGADSSMSYPSEIMVDNVRKALTASNLSFKEGTIWTTDAVFRETREKVEFYQKENVLGVEMEISAMLSVGKFRGVRVGGLLVVSDELSSFSWKPGFQDKRFIKNCRDVCDVLSELCKQE